MPSYALKFYRRKADAPARGERAGNVSFGVGDDATAIRYVQTTYADEVSESYYTVLTTEDGRILWESRKPKEY